MNKTDNGNLLDTYDSMKALISDSMDMLSLPVQNIMAENNVTQDEWYKAIPNIYSGMNYARNEFSKGFPESMETAQSQMTDTMDMYLTSWVMPEIKQNPRLYKAFLIQIINNTVSEEVAVGDLTNIPIDELKRIAAEQTAAYAMNQVLPQLRSEIEALCSETIDFDVGKMDSPEAFATAQYVILSSMRRNPAAAGMMGEVVCELNYYDEQEMNLAEIIGCALLTTAAALTSLIIIATAAEAIACSAGIIVAEGTAGFAAKFAAEFGLLKDVFKHAVIAAASLAGVGSIVSVLGKLFNQTSLQTDNVTHSVDIYTN